MKKSALLLIGGLVAVGATLTWAAESAGHGATPGDKTFATFTCQDLLETAVEYRPEVVDWHDGYNARTDTLTETIDEAWEPLLVEGVVTECRATPDKQVSEVVRHTRHAREHASKG